MGANQISISVYMLENPLGRYANLISKMRTHEKIAQELESNEIINNPRSSEREKKEVFIKVVLKHTNLNEKFVRSIAGGL